MRDREKSSQRGDHYQQRVDRDGERQEQDAGDAQDEPDDQHAERGDDEDLAQKAGHERAAEGVRDSVGDDFEVRPAEDHQSETERGQREKDAEDAGG